MTGPMKFPYPRRGNCWAALHAVYTVALSVLCVWDIVHIWYQALPTETNAWVAQLAKTGWSIVLWIVLWYACLHGTNAFHLLLATQRIIGPVSLSQALTMERLALISRNLKLIRCGKILNPLSWCRRCAALHSHS